MELEVSQIAILVPDLVKVAISSETEGGLKVVHSREQDDDHKFVDIRTKLSLDQVSVTLETHKIKDFLTDTQELMKILKVLQKPTNSDIPKRLTKKSEHFKEFKEIIVEYKLIDFMLKEQDEIGLGLKARQGKVKKKAKEMKFSTDSAYIYLTVFLSLKYSLKTHPSLIPQKNTKFSL